MIFDVGKLAEREGGEYVLGSKDLHSDFGYMIYGLLGPGECERLIRPGDGYEEIMCAVTGPLMMHTERGDILLEKGKAVHVRTHEAFTISNPHNQSLTYIITGGRTECDKGVFDCT